MSILEWLNKNPREYTGENTDLREDAFVACRSLGLGLDLTSGSVNHLTVGDFVRLAYTAGREHAEARLSSRDVADGIAAALDLPESVLPRVDGETTAMWRVRAVQQVVAYGVPK